MIIVEFVGQVVLRLIVFALAAFLAVCLGLMTYVVFTAGLPLLHSGHAHMAHMEFVWATMRYLDLVLWVVVTILLGLVSIGIFGWGLFGAFDG